MALTVRYSTEALLYPIIGFFGGLFLVFKGFSWLKRKRIIEDIPTSKVRSIAMGLVEVNGKAHPATKTVVTSPLTGKRCAHYLYKVEKYVQSGKSGHWRTIKRGESTEPFFVQDETGKVLVDPTNAEAHVPMSYHSESRWGKDPEPAIRKFLEKENIRFEGALFGANYTMRFREWVIGLNDEVYVMGEAADNPYVEEATAAKGVEDVMIKKGKDKILIISNKKEKQILNTLKLKAFGGIIGGILLSVICLAIVVAFITG